MLLFLAVSVNKEIFQVITYGDSYDWKDYGVEDIIRRCTQDKNLKNGSIILMHNGAKFTPEALEGIIIGLQEQGYAIVPVSELIYKNNFVVDHTGRQVAK